MNKKNLIITILCVFGLSINGAVSSSTPPKQTRQDYENSLANTQKIIELLQGAGSKDGAYVLTKEFSTCQGLFAALADAIGDPGHPVSKNLMGYSRGAKFAAITFWASHSSKYAEVIEGLSASAKMHYGSIISVNGVGDDVVIKKMGWCGDLNELQAKIIDDFRKNQ